MNQHLNSDRTPIFARVTGAESELGTKLGYWQIGREFRNDARLTDAGLAFFKDISADMAWQGSPLNVQVKEQPERMVSEVTGIGETPAGEAVKEVQFKWIYVGNSLSPWLSTNRNRGSRPGADGFYPTTAIVRRFDDGWRVEKADTEHAGFDVHVSNLPGAKEAMAQLAAREQADAAERVQREERERIAKTPTQVLGRFELVACPREFNRQRTVVVVTDSNVTIERPEGSGDMGTFGYWDVSPSFSRSDLTCGPLSKKRAGILRIGRAEVADTENSQVMMNLVEVISLAHITWVNCHRDRDNWQPTPCR